jgi:hypothetical protein
MVDEKPPEIKVGTRLRYLEAPNHYWKTGSVYPILEVQESGSFIVAVEPTAHFPEQWQPADKLGTRWEIVDEPKQEKPKKVPVRRGGMAHAFYRVELWNKTAYSNGWDYIEEQREATQSEIQRTLFDYVGKSLRALFGSRYDHLRVPESFTGPLPEWCEWEKGSEPKPDGYEGCWNCAKHVASGNDGNACKGHEWHCCDEQCCPVCPDWIPDPPF